MFLPISYFFPYVTFPDYNSPSFFDLFLDYFILLAGLILICFFPTINHISLVVTNHYYFVRFLASLQTGIAHFLFFLLNYETNGSCLFGRSANNVVLKSDNNNYY